MTPRRIRVHASCRVRSLIDSASHSSRSHVHGTSARLSASIPGPDLSRLPLLLPILLVRSRMPYQEPRHHPTSTRTECIRHTQCIHPAAAPASRVRENPRTVQPKSNISDLFGNLAIPVSRTPQAASVAIGMEPPAVQASYQGVSRLEQAADGNHRGATASSRQSSVP